MEGVAQVMIVVPVLLLIAEIGATVLEVIVMLDVDVQPFAPVTVTV